MDLEHNLQERPICKGVIAPGSINAYRVLASCIGNCPVIFSSLTCAPYDTRAQTSICSSILKKKECLQAQRDILPNKFQKYIHILYIFTFWKISRIWANNGSPSTADSLPKPDQ